ncbi:nitroreductase [Pseudomonadales bacterium]|nr:nitroreductase [Pseudomonadales bacterium]MDB9879872.1 nitroreductase [Pseudomonadales bacterium]MDC0013552.1 nitroreductase [Pseudomonadales bacterium]MDC0174375.1 nitroreductase [Pseudomonadales bacterium]MDC1306359.1 nitroreductase [Pseudomonadales bacterium]
MNLDEAIRHRKSVRQFLDTPVDRALVESILERANLAPSGTNVQPWHVHVAMGAKRDELVSAVLAHRENAPQDVSAEFPRTSKRKEPYTSRMRQLGKDMYSLLEIPRGDERANFNQWGRNYKFFDAPVGLIFTIDKDLDAMSFLDIGMFMQNIMLIAHQDGLATCSQGAWNQFHTVTRRVLSVPDDRFIICGMSLGYADPSAPVNTLVSAREPLSSFATFN